MAAPPPAGGPPPASFHALFSEPSLWDSSVPTYTEIIASVGQNSGSNQTAVRASTLAMSSRFPMAYVFVLHGDQDFIYVGHSPTVYPADVRDTCPFDDKVTFLIGNKDTDVIPLTVEDAAFSRTAAKYARDVATTIGTAGHGATPPSDRDGPYTSLTGGVRGGQS